MLRHEEEARGGMFTCMLLTHVENYSFMQLGESIEFNKQGSDHVGRCVYIMLFYVSVLMV